MQILIVTGLSGSGKSEAMDAFEDMGYYCLDNLPPALIPKFAELCAQSEGILNKVALGVDIRGYDLVGSIETSLAHLCERGYAYSIVFLEARDSILIRRYKMSRRSHPLSKDKDITQALAQERRTLAHLRQLADVVMDTSDLTPLQLREDLGRKFSAAGSQKINLTLESFGFKHGIPLDADMVFDVRFLPNPYYEEKLRDHTGDHPEVAAFVMNHEDSHTYYRKIREMVEFLLPRFIQEGKHHAVIAIGCTGGRHRSVTFINALYEDLAAQGYIASKKHRDAKLR